MRTLLILLVSLGVAAASHAADAVTGRVIKVLPFFVDQQGRIAVSPSLFDRDAYQAHLRDHTNEISAIRYDILWTATKSPEEKLTVAVELRGAGTNGVPKVKTLAASVTPGTYRQWTKLPLAGDDFKDFGAVVAWHVTLSDGSRVLGEQKSFLW